MDDGAASQGDTRWMTYAELAALLGVSVETAQRRVFRARWERRPGNDGRARVSVPLRIVEEVCRTKATVVAPVDQDNNQNDEAGPAGTVALRLIDQLEATQAALKAQQREHAAAREAGTKELAEVRERLAHREGKLEGVRLSLEHAHGHVAEARQEATTAQSEAQEAQRKAAATADIMRRELEEAQKALERLRQRKFWARLRNKGA